jgi:hypothetical protein
VIFRIVAHFVDSRHGSDSQGIRHATMIT